MRHRRSALALVAITALPLLSACASAPPGGTGANAAPTTLPQIRGAAEGYSAVETRRGGTVQTHSRVIEAPADSVFKHLPDVYESLKIPFETVVTSQRTLGNARFATTRTLNGERLSQYFDCGINVTGQVADQARVTMNIVTQVVPKGPSSSEIATRIEASARPLNAAQQDPLGCSTTGRLEIIISELAKRRVGL